MIRFSKNSGHSPKSFIFIEQSVRVLSFGQFQMKQLNLLFIMFDIFDRIEFHWRIWSRWSLIHVTHPELDNR
jgi:hypothetical protein